MVFAVCLLPQHGHRHLERRKSDKTTKSEDEKNARLQDIPSGRSSNPLSAMFADVVCIEITGKEHRDQDAVGREEDEEGCFSDRRIPVESVAQKNKKVFELKKLKKKKISSKK